tara:strand:+ start:606 stop:812 length:207 start_codon:yes stop_codon:yes gene_type:complete
LRSSIKSAESTIVSALNRKESICAHQRSDYPEKCEKEKLNYKIKLNKNKQLGIEKSNIKKLNHDKKNI